MEIPHRPEKDPSSEFLIRLHDGSPITISNKTTKEDTENWTALQNQMSGNLKKKEHYPDQTDEFSPKLTKKLPIGSIIKIRDDVYEAIEPLHKGEHPNSTHVKRIDERIEGRLYYSDVLGNLPLAPSTKNKLGLK